MLLYRHILINTQLVSRITGLLSLCKYPTTYFVGKENDREFTSKMKHKYVLGKSKRVYDITSIGNQDVIFATRVLENKLLHKCWPNQVPALTIDLEEKYAEGVHMNWETFLLNEFFTDFCEAQ